MKSFIEDLVSQTWSKTYREYYRNNLPDWNFNQIICAIGLYVRSRWKAAELYAQYSKLLSNQDEIRMCRLLARDAKRIDDVSSETEAFYRRIWENNRNRYCSKMYLVDLQIPVLFKDYEIVRYIDRCQYGNRPQIGILVYAEADGKSCQIYNLNKMNVPREIIYWEGKADIVNSLYVEKYNERLLSNKATKNFKIIRERLEKAGGWPVFPRLMNMKEKGNDISWW